MNPKQASIHSFFPTLKKDGTTLELRRFFYLHWSNKYSPKMQAVWLSQRPTDVNYIQEVEWNQVRKSHTFYLCAHFPDLTESRFDVPHEPKYKNISNLKSHLQKSIRKGNEQLALSTAIHLMKMDIVELLRRLPIIMIEDTSLHESFPTLVWLMIAVSLSSNPFRLKKYMYEWILGVIYVIAKMEKKDVIEYDESIYRERLLNQLESYHVLEDDAQISVLYSMHMRVAYGGMECDMRMFEQYAHIWFQRFQRKEMEMNKIKIRNLIFTSIKWLELDDWDLSAIDFHCAPKIIEFMQKRFPDIDEMEMKKIIWENASSINIRVSKPIYRSDVWMEMKTHLQRTQRYLLDGSF